MLTTFSRPRRRCVSPVVVGLCQIWALGAFASTCAVAPSEARATSYQIQTRTAARATQHLRADTGLAAPRVVSQSLTLSAYDLRDNQSGDLNARISLRYSTDLGLAREFRDQALFDSRWNDLSLDLAYLQWRPASGLEMTAGRQWNRSPLGVTDFDGLSAAYEYDTGSGRPFVEVAAGRDVQRGLTPWDPAAWDVQGLPPNESAVADDPWHWMAAARAGITASDRRHRTELASRHHRRPRADDADTAATTHHIGASATASPFDVLTLTTTASVHTLTPGFDRARFDAAWRIRQSAFSAGIDHRRPVFDAASIFNLFGAQPHRSVYATYRRPFQSIASAFELRGWTRLYFDEDASFFDTGDERAVGAAVAGHHRLQIVIPFDLSWQTSAQTITDGSGGDQYLGTTRVRAPGPMDGLFLTGRIMALYADIDHHRRQGGLGLTASVGAELDVSEIGELSLTIESRTGPRTPTNNAAFALFELESWR